MLDTISIVQTDRKAMSMTSWNEAELAMIGQTEELRISSRRRDGTVRPYVTIWVVRVGDDLYVRSAYGADNPWFVRAKASRAGRIRASGIERDVTFEDAPPGGHAAIDAAYHAKYDRHGPRIVGTVVGSHVASLTLRLVRSD